MKDYRKSDYNLYLRDSIKFGVLVVLGCMLNYAAYQIPDATFLVTPLIAVDSKPIKPAKEPEHQIESKKEENELAVPYENQNSMTNSQSFPFDPNVVTAAELQRLGFSSYVSKNWEAYRSAGGRFQSLDDVLKIYGIDTALVEQVISYIRFPKSLKAGSFNQHLDLDVNLASVEEWQHLKGIGPVLSKRIVKFRDALGGFYSIEQVGHTFGLPDSTFRIILPQLKLASPHRQIAINSVSEDTLKSHPYVSWKQARIFVRYRKERGKIMNIDDLKNCEIFDSEELDLLAPYLNFTVPEQITKDSASIQSTIDLPMDSIR